MPPKTKDARLHNRFPSLAFFFTMDTRTLRVSVGFIIIIGRAIKKT
jgi:hypothetical protein